MCGNQDPQPSLGCVTGLASLRISYLEVFLLSTLDCESLVTKV